MMIYVISGTSFKGVYKDFFIFSNFTRKTVIFEGYLLVHNYTYYYGDLSAVEK